MAAVLHAQDVSVRVGDHPLLSRVTVELVAGSWHGLVGPNGSGKTTLMRSALGLLPTTDGRVEVFGSVPPAPAGSVGVSFGPRLMHPARRAGTELLLRVAAAGGSRDDVDRAWAETGLPDRRVPCGTLSLGQAQRLSVVAALATAPRLLVLDEPTVGMDLASVAWLRERLRRYTAEGGCAWVSSHDLAEIERSADVLHVMHDGRVTFTGSVQALTGTARPVLLRSSEPVRLEAVLARAGLTYRTTPDGAVFVEADSPIELGRLLAREGVPLTEMGEQRSTLEGSLRELQESALGQREVAR